MFMPITRIFGRLILAAVVLVSSPQPIANAQAELTDITSFPDLLRMLAAQPDHQADWKIVINEEKFGVHLTRHIKFARKQDKTRQEFYPLADAEKASQGDRNYTIFGIIQQGQPAIACDPQAMTCTEM